MAIGAIIGVVGEAGRRTRTLPLWLGGLGYLVVLTWVLAVLTMPRSLGFVDNSMSGVAAGIAYTTIGPWYLITGLVLIVQGWRHKRIEPTDNTNDRPEAPRLSRTEKRSGTSPPENVGAYAHRNSSASPRTTVDVPNRCASARDEPEPSLSHAYRSPTLQHPPAQERHDPLGRRRSEMRVEPAGVDTGGLVRSAVPVPGRAHGRRGVAITEHQVRAVLGWRSTSRDELITSRGPVPAC
jgi:hypothetical protein